MSMKVDLVSRIREQLVERQGMLNSSVGDQISEMMEQPEAEQGGVDSGDLSNQELETELQIDRTYREAYELSLVNDALARIESGEYGKCTECGCSIESDRLLANPISKRCLDCQTSREEDQDERDSTPSL